MPSTKGKNDQFSALTSLRFLAALLVFVYHFQPRSGVLQVVIGQGHVGVGVFFVLSGFLITLRYFPDQARGELRLGEYFLRRAARILPLYYTVFILSQLLASGGLSFADRLPEWTLTQALFGDSLHLFVIPTSWSLTVEECFYAFAPVVFLAIAAAQRRVPRRPMLAAAAVLAGVTLLLFAAGVAIWTVLRGRGVAGGVAHVRREPVRPRSFPVAVRLPGEGVVRPVPRPAHADRQGAVLPCAPAYGRPRAAGPVRRHHGGERDPVRAGGGAGAPVHPAPRRAGTIRGKPSGAGAGPAGRGGGAR